MFRLHLDCVYTPLEICHERKLTIEAVKRRLKKYFALLKAEISIGTYTMVFTELNNAWRLRSLHTVYVTCKLMLCLICRFGKLRFVKLKDLLSADLPLLPSEFEALVKTHCWEAHEELRKR